MDLQFEYRQKFFDYYFKLITESYSRIGKEGYFSSIRRFNIIMKGENSDFQRLIPIIENPQQKAHVLEMLGSILSSQGMYATSVRSVHSVLSTSHCHNLV